MSQGEARRERRVLLATALLLLFAALAGARKARVPLSMERKRLTPTSTRMSSNRGQWEGRVRRGRVRAVEAG